MNNLLRRLEQERERSSYLLSALKRQLNAIREGCRADYPLLGELLEQLNRRLGAYRRSHEHLFCDSQARHQPELARLVDEIRQRHSRLYDGGRQCRQAVEDVLNDCLVPRQALLQPGLQYLNGYPRYLQCRERAILAVASTLVAADRPWAADWPAAGNGEHYNWRAAGDRRRGAPRRLSWQF
ncbi:hypothetical protein [Alkalilimnicola sp. S0819]|uniref:hypothetical protein n=1 Tax=Alkalilimnicola sp. S0819 TaxID=2613922 RepID=UPI001261C934|nr:hypothetical protein [Alkalilimnicola sp. S0819]KAB7624196.1 hypothetical protein F3N43_07350 [Alkalilimnicola sp. S0819]MPQ16451.1 hypothetical protein [Alkalilimnicola sp. S0819]